MPMPPKKRAARNQPNTENAPVAYAEDKKINAEIALGKVKIGRASLSENADDLPRDQLKTDKCGGENSGYGYDLFFQGVTNPAVQLCSVVEAKDGLAALSDADGKCHDKCIDLYNHSRTCKRNIASVGGKGTVVCQSVV